MIWAVLRSTMAKELFFNPFNQHSDRYATYRPSYPKPLFEWLASQCSEHNSAWDSATGNGQAAIGLSPYFNQVQATDISEEQIKNAMPNSQVTYSVRASEDSGFPDASMDLITVAQALHWFDFKKFWPEVKRVSTENAFFCAWGYNWIQCTPKIERQLLDPFREAMIPFWSEKNAILWDGYQEEAISFPFERIIAPTFEISETWSFKQLTQYLHTWSAFKKADERTQQNMASLFRDVEVTMGQHSSIPIKLPLQIIAARIAR